VEVWVDPRIGLIQPVTGHVTCIVEVNVMAQPSLESSALGR
jgi:hypothetical protein